MLTQVKQNDFTPVYKIMEESFPDDEYRPLAEQLKLFENKEYKVYVLSEQNMKPLGFAAVWEFDDFLFLEHFAVDKNERNKGLGAKILAELVCISPKQICLEVEPPENELSARRIDFYKRCGFYLNSYPYVQPPISKGKNEIPLMIMSHGKALSKNEFENFRDKVYEKVYKTGKVN